MIPFPISKTLPALGAVAALCGILSGDAQAAVVQYSYTGNALILDDPHNVAAMSGYVSAPVLPGLTLGFSFDEDLYGGSLAGHSIAFSNYIAGYGIPQLTMTNALGETSIIGPFHTDARWEAVSPFSNVNMLGTLFSVSIFGSCALTFDANADVAHYSCFEVFDPTEANQETAVGVNGDYYNAAFAELFFEETPDEVFFEGEYFAAPGSWSRTELDSVTAVPLLSSMGYLLSAFLPALGMTRRRLWRRPDQAVAAI